MDLLRWLWLTDGGLAVRIAAGVAVLTALALWDIRRHGRAATRWREYLFLLTATAAAMTYALLNDMITVTISPVYFLAHENLPYDTPGPRLIAAVVALKAGWTPGLLLGVAMLLANNPRRTVRQLPMRRLYAKLGWPACVAALLAMAMGVAGFALELGAGSPALERQISVVLLAHLGTYIGGGLGGIVAVWSILRERAKLRNVESHTIV
jgi:hypothetical protein